jgi:hypothetical protein
MLAAEARYLSGRGNRPRLAESAHSEIQGHADATETRVQSKDGNLLFLDSLKDEFLQLAVEYRQRRISQQEHEKATTALQQMLKPARRAGWRRWLKSLEPRGSSGRSIAYVRLIREKL